VKSNPLLSFPAKENTLHLLPYYRILQIMQPVTKREIESAVTPASKALRSLVIEEPEPFLDVHIDF